MRNIISWFVLPNRNYSLFYFEHLTYYNYSPWIWILHAEEIWDRNGMCDSNVVGFGRWEKEIIGFRRRGTKSKNVIDYK